MSSERILVCMLRAGGTLLLCAFGAVFLPVEWMAATHRWLGMGRFPASPLTDYLTRSASALYGFHGGLLLVVSTDVVRYAPVVGYCAWMGVGFGVLMVGIDLHAGVPWRWALVEGPSAAAAGVAMLFLLRRLRADPG